ncbi:hypothetical protein H7X65_00985 [Candidatus Parcubacteria bacterium]|nr:hypothetical protein [Candidatus Parcubacteria bacterium]
MNKFLTLLIISLFFSSATNVFAIEKTGPATVQEIGTQYCAQFTPGLKFGDTDKTTGGQITKLQNILYFTGYLKAKPNGKFDTNTKNAMALFAKIHVYTYKKNINSVDDFIISALRCPASVNEDWGAWAGYVYSPSAGSIIKRNEKVDISWNITPPLFSSATLKLISNTNPKKTYVITNNAPGFRGRFSWKVGITSTGTKIPDGLYTLELCEIGAKAYCTTTEKINLTSVAYETFSVMAPKKNEVLTKLATYTIRWTPTNLGTVDIDLLGGGVTMQHIAKGIPGKDGKFEWTVPYNLNSDDPRYPIQIKVSRGLVSVKSEPFKVKYQSDTKIKIDSLSSTNLSLSDKVVVSGTGFGTMGNLILMPAGSTSGYYSTGYGTDENGQPLYKYGQVTNGTTITFDVNYFDIPSHRLVPGKYNFYINAFDPMNETVRSENILVNIK